MVDDFKKYLSVRDIAGKFGVTEEWIRDLIQAKKIKAGQDRPMAGETAGLEKIH